MPPRRRGLWLLLAALAVWGGWFIYRTSFEVAGRRTFCLFDDAMISMGYARNLVEDGGLRWGRQGEPVEGFSHPLWTALMVGVNALPIELRHRSLLVQLLSLALLALHVVLVRRLMLRHFAAARARHWMPAALLTAFYYPLASWALLGMETALQALLTTALVLLALDIVYLGKNRHLELWLLATAAYLLRMDMLPIVAVVELFVLVHRVPWRAARRVEVEPGAPAAPPADAVPPACPAPHTAWTSWIVGLGIFLAAALGYELFRWSYFHDLLPNTYYLKLDGIPLEVRLLRGVSTLAATLRDHALLLLAVAIGMLAALRRHRDPSLAGRLGLPAALFCLCCLYSLYVGGDAWELPLNVRANRFVVFAMPLVFILFNALLNLFLDALGERQAGLALAPAAARQRRPPPRPRALLAGSTALALIAADGLLLAAHPLANQQDLLGLSSPLHVDFNQQVLCELVELEQRLAPSAMVATGWAGIPGYFSRFRLIDLFGYNDRHIAHELPAIALGRGNYEAFWPGHDKWDYPFVLRQYHPDAFFLSAFPRGDLVPLLRASGYQPVGPFWLRPGSPFLRAARPWAKAIPHAYLLPSGSRSSYKRARARARTRSASGKV